ARSVLRRTEGGQSLDQRDRRRPFAARERQPVREGQCLDLARSLPARRRRPLPRQQTEQAADGRARLPPLPEPEQRSAAEGLSVAEDRLYEHSPDTEDG